MFTKAFQSKQTWSLTLELGFISAGSGSLPCRYLHPVLTAAGSAEGVPAGVMGCSVQGFSVLAVNPALSQGQDTAVCIVGFGCIVLWQRICFFSLMFPLQAKVAIRELLPSGLRESISKVRSSVAYAVSAIAHWDWPEAWPELFNLLMEMLVSGDVNAVHGAMRVLTGRSGPGLWQLHQGAGWAVPRCSILLLCAPNVGVCCFSSPAAH